MPSPSANPKRLQVIDRIVNRLQAITAGSDFFFTPARVAKKLLHIDQTTATPVYMVMAGEQGGPIEEDGPPDVYHETFYVSVKGVIRDNADTVTKCEQALRDIRRAINEDTRPTAGTGSLHDIADRVIVVKGPDMDDGYNSLNGFGYFDQQFQVEIHGDFGEL
jgi:hypothetical protein